MLTLNGKKMAKSTGNNILPGEILSGENTVLSKAFSASVTRFFMLQAHYRSVLDFSNDAILAAEKGYNRLMEAVTNLNTLSGQAHSTLNIAKWKQECYDAMNDDFNSPILIAHLFEGVRFINIIKEGKATLTGTDLATFKTSFEAYIFEVLGLENAKDTAEHSSKVEGLISILIEMRNLARANKDFGMSDSIRDQLIDLGIQLKDGKEGTTFSL
jgi:cysteinyl-tRNA synthetase